MVIYSVNAPDVFTILRNYSLPGGTGSPGVPTIRNTSQILINGGHYTHAGMEKGLNPLQSFI